MGMFNLDQTISEWRRRMLAAGITAPVPLEELEIHLREEIDGHIRSGLNEAEAFKAAADKMGQARLLQTEFKKVKASRVMIRAILLVMGWLAAGYVLFYSFFCLDWDWNFFNFSPKLNRQFVEVMSSVLVALVAMWFLVRASRDKTSRVLSMLVCGCLAWFSIQTLQPEKIKYVPVPAFSSKMTDQQAIAALIKYRISSALSRSKPSPFWFRGGQTLLLALPGIFWVGWAWRDLVRKRRLAQEDQLILSN
jgi:hypothetical protein